MTSRGFIATHAEGAVFDRGQRAFYEYRDLGIKAATDGRVVAHVIRAAAGAGFSSAPHVHKNEMLEIVIPADFSTEVVALVQA